MCSLSNITLKKNKLFFIYDRLKIIVHRYLLNSYKQQKLQVDIWEQEESSLLREQRRRGRKSITVNPCCLLF